MGWVEEVIQANANLDLIGQGIEKFKGDQDEEIQLMRARYKSLRDDIRSCKYHGSGRVDNEKVHDLGETLCKRLAQKIEDEK